ncbi:nicotinate-nucleotide--dimethylbenzimidazole phosphoribosyltransferase [Pedobacter puniceum]|uniref:Nicotinate-nucleotide--dimethylbenzimidazole phosphoribosyltransferase n=1 Tax=Pedobacter puniceum TaxID=2666136 RepID=A0A7K0FMU9_9SPHI|nr:nicotinate-nucleotide--dimethylbenzimidazole phosphoribosyltransferase [Pedobacter puniceum]MRX46347.1 nicotinate-nucleotide--dimethylbenzimidazole phosphoribosyltransferase [Pedobacter puniceum]
MISKFEINSLNPQIKEQVQHIINHKTKPLGALGILEDLALRICLIQETVSPKIASPTVVVFAGDHGITQEGVSPYPQEVSWQMVMNFIAGGAAINVFTKQNGWDILVVDAGVNHDFDPALPLQHLKVAKGTQNFLHSPAMTKAQLDEALEKGTNLVKQIHAKGSNCIAFGEMGIGNTSAAAAIMHKITGIAMEACAGRGTGLNDEGLEKKIAILKQAIINNPAYTPEEILQTFGGFEIAMIVGAMLSAAQQKMLIVVDGFIVSSALLIAHALYPQILDYCVFAHQSDETGHKQMLQFLKAKPLLNLNMRLGEGTGAALALPIIQASVNFINEMSSFESAGVRESEDR